VAALTPDVEARCAAPWRALVPMVLALLVLGGCAHRSGATLDPKGVRDAVSTAEELSRALDPRSIAVVVGVDAYRHPAFPDLRFAADDAEAMAELLLSPEGGGFDRVVVLTEQADRETVLRELRNAAADLLPDDVFLFYFSGHGTLQPASDEVGRLFLLPSDANPADLESTALELLAVREFFSGLPAERKALIVDACFHGEGKSVLDPSAAASLDALVANTDQSSLRGLGAGEAHLFASTLGRPAFEDAELGHGVYTHYLLQAMTWARAAADLDGDSLLTAWEAHDFARSRTAEHTGGQQIAEASFRVVGGNDLLMAGDPAARSTRERALLFHYGGSSGLFAGSTLVVDGAAKGVFPGTFAIEPGRHHVEVRDPDGKLTVDGYAELSAGQSVPARDLGVLVREDRVVQSFRAGVGGGPAAWGPLWGDGFVALELWTALRVPRGKAKGLFGAITLGAAVSPTRRDLDRLTRQGRGTFWFAGELGYGADYRRLRLRGSWQVRGTLLPVARFPGEDHPLLPEETGWFFASTGPSVHVGVILDRRASLVAVGTLQLTRLDPQGTGTPTVLPFGSMTVGLEFGF